MRGLFADHYDTDTIGYYMQFIGQIDAHFEFGFSHRRLQLLEWTIEYLECNMVEAYNDYEKLIRRDERSQTIVNYIDEAKGEGIGLSVGKLLSLNWDDEVH